MNIFYPELQLTYTKAIIKNNLKELLADLKKFKVQTILALEYNKSAKLIASDSDIEEAFESVHQSIITKIENYASEDWIALD